MLQVVSMVDDGCRVLISVTVDFVLAPLIFYQPFLWIAFAIDRRNLVIVNVHC